MLVDLRPKGLNGKIAEEALGKAGITVNKNMIPWDPEKPFVTSGVRVGSPALTTRGMDTAAMATVARLIVRVLDAPADEASLARVRGEVRELCAQFPMYSDLLGAPKAKASRAAGRKPAAKRAAAKGRTAPKAKAKAKKAARPAKRPARRAKR
jgi:hypothetical protein